MARKRSNDVPREFRVTVRVSIPIGAPNYSEAGIKRNVADIFKEWEAQYVGSGEESMPATFRVTDVIETTK